MPERPTPPTTRRAARLALAAAILSSGLAMSACGDQLLRRRVDVDKAQGADPDLERRFGITSDAQDPSERDEELGYGRWKQAPETEGTAPPTSYKRRTFGDD